MSRFHGPRTAPSKTGRECSDSRIGTANESDQRRRAMQLVLGSLLLVATLAACSSEYDWLVAEYTVQPNAPALVKVTKSGSNYRASIRLGPDWSEPLRLNPCSDADYAHQFGAGWKDVQPVGLCAQRDEREAYPFGIFKVQQGARARQHRFRTGYFVEFGGAGHGAGDLFRL